MRGKARGPTAVLWANRNGVDEYRISNKECRIGKYGFHICMMVFGCLFGEGAQACFLHDFYFAHGWGSTIMHSNLLVMGQDDSVVLCG